MNEAQEVNEIKCIGCGDDLKFVPGSTTHITCGTCGTDNEIPVIDIDIEELDFHKYLQNQETGVEKEEIVTVKCAGCGAESTLQPNIVSDDCAFCGAGLVIDQEQTSRIIKPESLLPFKIERKEGEKLFKDWINGLWWAPNALKKYTSTMEKLHGMYIPYWTYDADTYSRYSGQRGDNYTTTESYTDSEGNRQTRTVTKTRWTNVSGSVNHFFDDVLVLASTSLPKEKTVELEPWDLENLVPYDERYLKGFQTEVYHVDVEKGFGEAKGIMDTRLRHLAKRDIGGDHQRIYSLTTQHSNITFKHTLLPIWISAYRYKDKPYRFLVNGRTGEVQGERPYSAMKIALAIIAGLIVITAIFLFAR